MSSADPEHSRRSWAASPGLSALAALVTLVAMLLFARVKVRALEWSFDYPLMSHEDPTRALFLFAEEERRVVQSKLVPRWLSTPGGCSACDAPSLAKRWRELLEEHQRYVDEGYRRHKTARWVREAEAARAISLAGWGDAEEIRAASALAGADLPQYLSDRAAEIARGDVLAERARARRSGQLTLLSTVLHFAFMLFALGALLAWKRGLRYPRRSARSRLVTPTLGRGLVIFVWAEGFVSVMTRLRWDNPDGPLEIFRMLPSLALALSVSVLLLGTRTASTDSPITALMRCPPDRRSRRFMWGAAIASIGAVYAFNWVHWRLVHWLGVLPLWSDGLRETELYGSLARALLARFSAVIIAPFAEELTYRGVLFGSLATRMSTHRAALISCIVFASVHGYGWYGFASVALCGYLWARLAARTGSLVPGMLAHGTFNLVISIFRLAVRA